MPTESRGVAAANQQSSESKRDLGSLLGPAPLLEGEDATAYDELWHRIEAAVRPADAIEEIWARDLVDLLWETTRLRRLKSKLFQSAAYEGLQKLLYDMDNEVSPFRESRAYILAVRWARRDPKAITEVDNLLKEAGLDHEAIAAQTLAVKLDTFNQLDRMIMQTEARRNAILREVDRRREALARRLREVTAAIDGELRESPPRKDAAE